MFLCMNDVIKTDLSKQIVEMLTNGENIESICRGLGCDKSEVMSVSQSADFLAYCAETLEKRVKSSSLSALKNIENIANNEKASDATRLKASQFIVDKALEFNELQGDSTAPSNMTQRQLTDRLQQLQAEAINRAKPVETGVIDLDQLTE